jgi:hypothetical protein
MSNLDIFSDKLLINLRILSKIPKNGKICRSSDGVISLEYPNSGILTSMRRFLTSDSRKQTLLEINKIITDSILKFKEITQTFGGNNSLNEKKEILNILREELSNSICGIENLKTTYQDDQTMISHLDIYILKIRTVVLDITNYISKHTVIKPNPSKSDSSSRVYHSLNEIDTCVINL